MAPTFDLSSYLDREGAEVERALERAVERLGGRPAMRAAPGAELMEVVRHGLMTGGKRLRPILCVAAYRACGKGKTGVAGGMTGGAAGGDGGSRTEGAARGFAPGAAAATGEDGDNSEGAAPDLPSGAAAGAGAGDSGLYDLAASLEMIHAYSLMHDDLPCMDDAELRRGKPTPHILFGGARTTRAGALLIPAAALQAWEGAGALGCGDLTRREIVRELARAAGAGGMVGGQALDLLGEGRRLAADELDALHALKTGALLAASLRIGSLAAGAGAPVRAALDEYGRDIGLAFQIVDDVLDATASAGALGKNPSDRELEKSTYVALHGLEEAESRACSRVESARAALEAAGIDAPALVALSAFIVERGH